MTSILFERKPKVSGPEPMIAAFYSIVPGIGQLYNGKTRKGILFLLATFTSLLVLYATLNPESTIDFAMFVLGIFQFLLGFIFKLDIQPSPSAHTIIETISFGGPFSTSLIVLILFFVIYSMCDAYIDAENNFKSYDYKINVNDPVVFRFSESAASSYIIHIIFLSIIFLLSLFLVFPKKEIEQVTEIEFIMPQVESKKEPPPETKRISTVQSIDQGKHDPKKPITPPEKARPANPPPPQPKAQPQVKPLPIAMPQPIVEKQKVEPKPEEPKVIKPLPKAAPKTSNLPALEDAPMMPAPIAATDTGSSTNSAPKPVAPAPVGGIGVVGGTGTSAKIVAIPQVPGIGGRGGLGSQGNPPPNDNPDAASSIAARRDVDFGPYMEELQRRIKRAWRPPRGNESKRVIVTFKISKDGSISELTIKNSSSFKPSDDAALLAVQSASPFAPLPPGSPSSVDIEFTFDYNVFGAGGR